MGDLRAETCEQDDHERVFQAGREAGHRDALIALAENQGQFFDELDRNIADALRSDLEYVRAHNVATLREAAPLIRRALNDPGSFVKRGKDYEGEPYGERLDQWQTRAIEAAIDASTGGA